LFGEFWFEGKTACLSNLVSAVLVRKDMDVNKHERLSNITFRQNNVKATGIPISSTNKIDHHDIAEILLKLALNTINLLSKGKSQQK
jgi:hypothetical protein